MSGGYVLIAGVLLYIFLLQRVGSSSLSPIKAAIFFIVSYYILHSVVMGLLYSAWQMPILPNLLNLTTVTAALIQFAVALLVFYKADESGDDYVTYMLWGGAGLAVIFFVLPQVVQTLLSGS